MSEEKDTGVEEAAEAAPRYWQHGLETAEESDPAWGRVVSQMPRKEMVRSRVFIAALVIPMIVFAIWVVWMAVRMAGVIDIENWLHVIVIALMLLVVMAIAIWSVYMTRIVRHFGRVCVYENGLVMRSRGQQVRFLDWSHFIEYELVKSEYGSRTVHVTAKDGDVWTVETWEADVDRILQLLEAELG